MTRTIAQLWSGALQPARDSGKTNGELRQLETFLQYHLDALAQSLDPEQEILLNNYQSCLEEYFTVSSEQTFCDGFCLGAKLTAEALTGADQPAP